MKDEEIQLLKSRSFHLDCPSIELTSGDGAMRYAGPGYIRQNPEKDFLVTAFVSGALTIKDALEPFAANDDNQAGILIPHEKYWSLTAVDTKGRTWTAGRILSPEKDGCIGRNDGYMVRAQCRSLQHEDDQFQQEGTERRVGLEMHSFSIFDYPPNARSDKTYSVCNVVRKTSSVSNVATFKSCHFEFELVKEDDAMVLRASSTTSQLPAGIESRVSEALLFVLGALPPWSVIKQYDGKQITTKIANAGNEDAYIHRFVPLLMRLGDKKNQTWHLFDLFLKYILRGDPDHYHPISAQLAAISKTSAASVEARALTLAVAVETLLSEYFSDVAKPSSEHVARVDDLLNHVRQWSGNAVILERALGAMGNIKGTRPGDKLRELESKGLTTPDNRKAWTDLRNAAAHGDWSAVREDFQAFIDKTEQVRVLFYRLIFAIIGYEGKHTDWATHGWPLIQYPPGSGCPSTIPQTQPSNAKDEKVIAPRTEDPEHD